MKIETYEIELQDIHLYAYHGVLPQENKIGAWYTINICVTIDQINCIKNDDIESTVNYANIYETICEEMKIKSKLLEHVCGRILSKLFTRFPSITQIDITLIKDTPPLGGDRLNCAVKIKAKR